MADTKKDEEERKSGAVLPWGGRAGAGTGGWGGPAFGPGGWLKAAARAMAVSPDAMLLRVLAGAIVGVSALGLTATLYGRAKGPDGAPLVVNFDHRRPGEAPSDERAPMESLVRGMAGLWGPVLGLSDAPAASALVPDPDGEAVEPVKAAAEPAAPSGRPAAAGDESDEGAGRDGVGTGGTASAGASSAQLASADLGGGGSGGAGGAAGASAALPKGAATGAPSAQRDMRAGALRSARGTSGKAGKGALNQLKFAQNRSALGAASAGPAQSYGAAKSAFEGGAPGGAGSGIGGAGASQGGAGVGSSPANPRRVETGPMYPDSKRMSCPSGYTLDGADCKPLEGVNKTPYQGLADMAKAFLIAGAALALVGLLLITRPVPWMQILGGILLGAAAGLILAAVAIGADIQNRYGQKKQKDAIDSAAGRAGKGQNP